MNAVPAERLLRDRPALGRIVRAYSRAAGTDETAVAASLLFQAWAVSVTRPAGPAPRRGGWAGLPPPPPGGAPRLFVRRRTCCLRYRLHDAPPTCLSCRLLPEPERRRRISLRLETEAGERDSISATA